MCIVIVCFPGWEVINVEINLSFFIKPFSYMSKNLMNKSAFQMKQKAFFVIFKWLSVAKNCLRLEFKGTFKYNVNDVNIRT